MTPADVLLDARITRRMSVGMIAYANELVRRLPVVAPDLRYDVYRDGGNFGFAEHVALPRYIARTRPRLVHHLSVYAPLYDPRPYAITIHDLIHLHFPEQFKRTVGPYYQTIVRFVCARAARVLTDDPRTVVDLERFLGVDPAKVRVIPLGVEPAFLEGGPTESVERPYFLYAGNHRTHKDLQSLVSAWLALPADRAADLVLTGSADVAGLAATRDAGIVRFVGEVPPARLAALYRGAVAYVHPALREGFGLPMLEAAAAGTPVIASDGAVPKVLEAVTAIYPAGDAAALSALLRRALEEPADAQRRERLRATARFYTWDRTAAATAEVYREMLEESPTR